MWYNLLSLLFQSIRTLRLSSMQSVESLDFGGTLIHCYKRLRFVEKSMGRKKPPARYEENPQPSGGKSRNKALVIEDDEYSIGTELSEESQIREEKFAIIGKKGKKGNLKASLQKDEDFDDAGEVEEDEDDIPQVAFTGKKKGKSNKSGGNSVFSASSFGLLGDEDEGVQDDDKSRLTGGGDDNDDDVPQITFSGKKKKLSKKSGSSAFSASLLD